MKNKQLLSLLLAIVIVVLAFIQQRAGSDELPSETSERAESGIPDIEIPAVEADEFIVRHTGYTLSYDSNYNTPRWVAWVLTSAETDGRISRSQEFFEDPEIPQRHRVCDTEYRGSGYDRGHMCPAGDMQWSPEAMRECFYMSNMCPQDHQLNGVSWKRLEESCRRWARQEGQIYIVCGPIYKGKRHKHIGNCHEVAVPESFFKVVLSLRNGHEKGIGFVYTNSSEKQTMESTSMSIDDVERLTGLDFFPSLDDALENRVESNYDLRAWN